MSVLVYVENNSGKFKKTSYEVVSYAKKIAGSIGGEVSAVSIGKVDDNELANLHNYGASKVFAARFAETESTNNRLFSGLIKSAADQCGAKVIVMSNSFNAKGIAPRVAVKMKACMASGAIDLPETKKGFIVKIKAFSNKAFAWLDMKSEHKVITLNANAYKVEENKVSGTISELEKPANLGSSSTKVISTNKAGDAISLPEAELVVSAGRGMKGPENWGMIEELAKTLGAATACSKPVSDAGWRPHSEHVGQTGIAISPNLYIAIGISGAIQHLAGVSSSKTIVVINKDPEAPFFKAADYGVVGDAFEVVPKLNEALKTYKS